MRAPTDKPFVKYGTNASIVTCADPIGDTIAEIGHAYTLEVPGFPLPPAMRLLTVVVRTLIATTAMISGAVMGAHGTLGDPLNVYGADAGLFLPNAGHPIGLV